MPDGNSNETARCVGNAQRQAGGGKKRYVFKNKQPKDRLVLVAV